MPVTSVHAEYKLHKPQWTRSRDAYEGQDTVKGKTTTYLPKMAGQDNERYNAYIKMALWLAATRRTVQGLTGAMYRKEPQVVLPAGMEEDMRDVTLSGMTLNGFARRLSRETVMVGRYGILTDFAESENRPTLAGYDAEMITNWHTDRIGGQIVLTEVRLLETFVQQDPKDDFEVIVQPQYRVLSLEDGLYTVNVYRNIGAKDKPAVWVIVETLEPLRQGERLTFIPFTFINATNVQPTPDEPPLLGVVDANFDHYMLDAPYKHGLLKCSIPIYWAAGFGFGGTSSVDDGGEEGEPLNDKVYVSSDYAWTSDDSQARAGILEFSGQGLEPVRNAQKDLEGRMAMLGARILEESKAGVEAADTMSQRHAGEKSALSEIASVDEQGLKRALDIFAWWKGLSDEPELPLEDLSYTINKDYVAAKMPPAMLTALVQALQAGTIDYETFYWNLQQGELTVPGATQEDVQARIQEQVIPLTLLDPPAAARDAVAAD